MSLLVLNLGSTSFKYELFDSKDLSCLKKGSFEMTANEKGVEQEEVNRLFREMMRQIGNITEVEAVGHRVVHGGDKYFEVQEIDTAEIFELAKLNDLAPLHNPFNLAGIKASNDYLPDIKDWAVFDTVFFKNLPDHSKIYPIPYTYYEEKGIRRFGFHGISHKFAGQEAAKEIKIPFDKAKLVTVHLGGGSSICAIDRGKPIDTSMGYTPLEGLMMMTRCGDIGEGAVLEIIKNLETEDKQEIVKEVNHILNFKSGIKGISGKEDYLELLKSVKWGDVKSKLAFEMYIHRIKKYIGAYMAVLGEVDAIVFTGKIGAGEKVTRNKIFDKNKFLKDNKVVVVEPHEELAIARELSIQL